MSDRKQLEALLARVREAREPDRELFDAVCQLLLPYNWWVEDNRLVLFIHAEAWIDAALGLVEKVLPGWCCLLAFNSNKGRAVADIRPEPLGTDQKWPGHAAANMPLAILGALIQALIAEGKDDE